MTIEIWLTFIAACLVFSSIPGVGILSTVNHALSKNTKYTAFTILGMEFALAIYVLIVSVGLNVILTGSIILFSIIKGCGAAYLIWMGIQKLLNNKPLHQTPAHNVLLSSRKAIKTGMLVNFSNPKSIIFLAAFFPQFINPHESMMEQYIILGLTMIIIDGAFHSLYALFASKLKKHIINESHSLIINKVFGTLFISSGLLMASRS